MLDVTLETTPLLSPSQSVTPGITSPLLLKFDVIIV